MSSFVLPDSTPLSHTKFFSGFRVYILVSNNLCYGNYSALEFKLHIDMFNLTFDRH